MPKTPKKAKEPYVPGPDPLRVPRSIMGKSIKSYNREECIRIFDHYSVEYEADEAMTDLHDKLIRLALSKNLTRADRNRIQPGIPAPPPDPTTLPRVCCLCDLLNEPGDFVESRLSQKCGERCMNQCKDCVFEALDKRIVKLETERSPAPRVRCPRCEGTVMIKSLQALLTGDMYKRYRRVMATSHFPALATLPARPSGGNNN